MKINTKIIHETFGKGVIISREERVITSATDAATGDSFNIEESGIYDVKFEDGSVRRIIGSYLEEIEIEQV